MTIDAKESDYLYVKKSQIPNAGKGLFTAIPIYKDEIISIYKGEILSNKDAKIRAKKGNDLYFINMLNGTIMDSMKTQCFAKYANDAEGSDKTEFSNNSKISLDDNEAVCLIATKNIQTGEEIFCSYGKEYWKKHKT